MNPNEAQALALQAVAFLAGDEDRLERLMTLAGLDASELRTRIGEADFLAGILDFLLSDEKLLLDFAAEVGCRPEIVTRARMALPGGEAHLES